MSHTAQTSFDQLVFGRRTDNVSMAVVPWRSPVLIGRVALATIFLISGLVKLGSWGETVTQMSAEGVPWPEVMLIIAVALEIAGAVSVMLGAFARVGSLLLLAFLIPTTLVMHDFWNYEGMQQQMQVAHFMKNLSIMGGLLLILGFGPGRVSVDARIGREVGAIRES